MTIHTEQPFPEMPIRDPFAEFIEEIEADRTKHGIAFTKEEPEDYYASFGSGIRSSVLRKPQSKDTAQYIVKSKQDVGIV